jgi:TRAP-type mannitol/chloroaromatic compound transport system substrate-binding protein
MGGWFVNEIATIEDLRGLRYRMSGPGAEVYRRLGAVVVLVPGSEIVTPLRSGAIDACEWIGPWLDTVMGLHERPATTTIRVGTSRAQRLRSETTGACGRAWTRATGG